MTVVKRKEAPVPFVVQRGVTHGENGKFLKGHPQIGGRSHGVRERLTKDFCLALERDFRENGEEAIAACRVFDPGKYLHIIASLMPKEVKVSHEEQMSDGELESALKRLLFADIAATLTGETARPVTVIEGEAETISEEPSR